MQKAKKITRIDDKLQKSKTTFFVAQHEGSHRRLFLAAIDTWKFNKILGGGIKSFREDCWKLEKQPNINLSDKLLPDKKNRLCSNHPHNYYFEILTETGIAGLIITLMLSLIHI